MTWCLKNQREKWTRGLWQDGSAPESRNVVSILREFNLGSHLVFQGWDKNHSGSDTVSLDGCSLCLYPDHALPLAAVPVTCRNRTGPASRKCPEKWLFLYESYTRMYSSVVTYPHNFSVSWKLFQNNTAYCHTKCKIIIQEETEIWVNSIFCLIFLWTKLF